MLRKVPCITVTGEYVAASDTQRTCSKMRLGAAILCTVLLSTAMAQRELGILEIVLYESGQNGEYTTRTYKLTGEFSTAGTTISAEGRIIQVSSAY